ncbi:MAG: hypothetical protein M1540_01460 [Candidatus Bathyarchaeota archaeon]|nr:hypothetical protein [Candidatus Bathyarchaeota archaeon]
MRTKILGASLVFGLLISITTGLILVENAEANPYTQLHLPKITINNDGSVTPQTSYINRTGNTYTLTADIILEYSVEILCSNIVFDGADHVVNVAVEKAESIDGYPAYYMDVGVNVVDAHDVVVKNVEVFANNVNTINLQFSSNCQIVNVTTDKDIRVLGDYNTITQSNAGIAISQGNNNLITKNNITGVFVGSDSIGNRFYQNNFYLTDYPEFFSSSVWDNGAVGNYWANYSIKYPDVLEVDKTGIGDTPYTITRGGYTTKEYPNVVSIDHYPLMYPWGTPEVTLLNIQNQSYSGSVSLNFSLSKPAQWIKYSVDGGENVTITGNSTLEGLAVGLHNVTVYACDVFGEVGAETAEFTVDQALVWPVAAISVAAIGLTVAAIMSWKRVKKNRLLFFLRHRFLR